MLKHSLLPLAFVSILLPFSGGIAEASSRTLGSLALQSSSSSHIVMVRSGRMVALAQEEVGESVTPGSLPLDDQTERRIERYLVYDACPVTLMKAMEAMRDRCQYRLRQQRQLQSDARDRLRLNRRARAVIDAVQRGSRTILRSVATEKGQSTYRSEEALTGIRNFYEMRVGRPRNLRETSDAFQTEVKSSRGRLAPQEPEEEAGEE
jgi:hypothetical protein